jgi:glycosyltransferase involved in cell wall biosynthesis
MDRIKAAGKFDKIVLLSDWHREFWKQFGFDDKVTVIPDGIELARFKEHASSSKTRFIYSSSWDRGLDNVIYILNEVRKRTNNNDIILDVYYGDYNLVRTYKDLGLTHLCVFHNRILSHQQWDWIKFHGRVNQNELANAMSNSFCWEYPTYFEETCCLTAMEAMASGLPIIHNAYAGLRRFIDTGIAIDTGKLPSVFMDDKCDKRIFEPFIAATIELLRNPTLWKELSKQSLAKAQQYSWQKIVKEEWQKLIEG